MGVQQMTFGSLTVTFDDRVLRPRGWTMAQSYWAAELLRDAPAGAVLELCAGVGHIGLLAVQESPLDLVLVDLSRTACDYAETNARAARRAGSFEVRCGRVDEVLADDERFVAIIADPPWVPSEGTGRFPEDPLTAIDGGADGMDIAWACVDVAGRHLSDQGWMLLQLGSSGQAAAVRERLAAAPHLGLEVVEVRQHGERGVLVHVARSVSARPTR